MLGQITFEVRCFECTKIISVTIGTVLDECEGYCPECGASFSMKFRSVEGSPFLKRADYQPLSREEALQIVAYDILHQNDD